MKFASEYMEWFPERLAQLRTQKGVSARDMSLSLGQSAGYINKIENRHALPSIPGFLYICEYLGVTPQEFFAADSAAPQRVAQLAQAINKLKPAQIDHLLLIIGDITEEK